MTGIYLPKAAICGYSVVWDPTNSEWGYNEVKLAHLIHYDRKGSLRGLKRWQNVCHESLGSNEFDNIPLDGYSIGYLHSDILHPSSEVRHGVWVKAPKGNFIHLNNDAAAVLLSNANISKGVIKDHCVLGWSGGELFLIPVSSPVHELAVEFTANQNTSLKPGDFLPGCQYLSKADGGVATYLGRYEFHNIVGHNKTARNKRSSERHVFLKDQKWKVFNLNGFYRKLGAVSECELRTNIEEFLRYQQRTKLGDFVFVEPDVILNLIDSGRKVNFLFATTIDGVTGSVASLEVDYERFSIYGSRFNSKHIFQGKQISDGEINFPVLKDTMLDAMILKMHDDLFDKHVLSAIDSKNDFLRELGGFVGRIKAIGLKVAFREAQGVLVSFDQLADDTLEGLGQGIDPSRNPWALNDSKFQEMRILI